ncbi:MAG: hypothetical protein K9I34_05880 [Bacteroidales bacterium]|nr:hypothetical protein [Bacteroidales bacterium]
MVGPIYIIVIALGIAFTLGLLGKASKSAGWVFVLAGLAAMTFISAQWLVALLEGSIQGIQIFTAGYKPPYSISLQMGLEEAILTTLINSLGLLSLLYLGKEMVQKGVEILMVFMVFIMSMNVTIMTRDIFNLFVFLEIETIALSGLILLIGRKTAFQAGIKYLIISGIASGLLLIGIILAYSHVGTLDINGIASANNGLFRIAPIAGFLILISFIIELKPFPANGWGIDVYSASHPGIGALISGASATTGLYLLYKVLPVAGEEYLYFITLIGAITFIGSNLTGTAQSQPNRLLGYSSIGQVGLVTMILGLQPILGDRTLYLAFTIIISHYAAKAGLFWISGMVNSSSIKDWSILRKKPLLLVLFGAFILALIGFPPFPSFNGKWEILMKLGESNQYHWIAVILAGSFIEAIYLIKWLGYAIKLDEPVENQSNFHLTKQIPVWIMGLVLFGMGYYLNPFTHYAEAINYIPLLFALLLFAIDFLPVSIKNTITIAGLAYYFMLLWPAVEGDLLRQIFLVMFLGGGILTLLAGYSKKGKRPGFYSMAILMYAGLAGLLTAKGMYDFFFSWEVMTAGSYFLIIRGKRSLPHAYSYMLFSIGGAYLILGGFAIAAASLNGTSLSALSMVTVLPTWVYALIAVGFMTKTASLGLHIWLPGAHGEAESDVSPMVSAILLKAGVFGLLLLFISIGATNPHSQEIWYVLGWIGAITTLMGNMSAAFQEDAKRLLAYSSIAQLGYILFAFSMMTHIGWLAGFTYTINHFLFKAILFLIIGAIVVKLGTHNMYEMGGMIKKMPFSFIAVLISIIVIGGIPPLSGFAGKWLFYNAILEKGWYFQGALIFFAGIIAFLYLFKLIFSVFLGQVKDNHRNMKEISAWVLIPSYILIIGIMLFSAFPKDVLTPISEMIMPYFTSETLVWDGTKAMTSMGYWDGSTIMIVVGTAFMLLLGWLIVLSAKAQKVEQFNIVYAAERPFRPETTHVSHNIYAGYKKAIGFLVSPVITVFWDQASTFVLDFAGWIRRIYSGSIQNYAIHVIFYIVVFYLISLGGL